MTDPRKDKKDWLREDIWTIVIAIGGVIAMFAIFCAKAFRETDTIERAAAGQLGDFVGGFVGTGFALASVLLLYQTLTSQRRAFALQSFESRFFELVKMHRENVAELDLEGTTGRKIFVLLIREFRQIIGVVKHIAKRHGLSLDQRSLSHISYNVLFFGVGPNSSRILKKSLASFGPTFADALESELNNERQKAQVQDQLKFPHVPFEGHQSRLGHYYRHLYQCVSYVDQQDEQKIGAKRYEYVKTIRAQLTTHEQALLLINSLTPMGRDWWRKNLIDEYKMVQNLPPDFFDSQTELDVSELFPAGYFEWEESDALT